MFAIVKYNARFFLSSYSVSRRHKTKWTLCVVKILHQVQNSKCYEIRCCGSQCLRDVHIDLPEAEVPRTTATQTATSPPVPRVPRPVLDASAVAELRKRFEN
jgi:hypothetical protein